MISREYIKVLLETYSCNINKNKQCPKRCCVCNGGECKRTLEYKYAKRNIVNFIKKVINKIRGKYK